jgi:hypothetical protein
MNNQPPDDPQIQPDAPLDEILAKMQAIRDTLAAYEVNMPRHELKYIRNEEEMIQKMPFMKKALDLAFEHQELVTPEFLEKFWKDHVRFLNMKDLHDKFKEITKEIEKIFPEAANLPHKTTSTTTNGQATP